MRISVTYVPLLSLCVLCCTHTAFAAGLTAAEAAYLRERGIPAMQNMRIDANSYRILRVGSATGPNGWNTILNERSADNNRKRNGINKLCPAFAERAARTLTLAEDHIRKSMADRAAVRSGADKRKIKADFSNFKFCVDSPAVRSEAQQNAACARGASAACGKNKQPSKHTYGGAIDVGCTFQRNGRWLYDMDDVIEVARLLREVYPRTGLYTPNSLSGTFYKPHPTEKKSFVDLFHIQMREQDAKIFGCPIQPSGKGYTDEDSAYPGFIHIPAKRQITVPNI